MRRHSVDMRALFGSLLTLSCLGLLTACGDSESTGSVGPVAPKPVYTRVGSTSGGPIVVSRDESVAVATNRTAGVVTVLRLDPSRSAAKLVTSNREVDLGKGSEPWAAVLGKDDDSAYVIARHDSRVVRIKDLHGTPKVDGSVSVGSEPTSIVISPKGVRLFVANWGEGTLSLLSTPDAKPGSSLALITDESGNPTKIDLNEALAQTGFLGNVASRDGLAHPRAIAMTDNGDNLDNDETLYVTDFFSQPLNLAPPAPPPAPDGGAPPPPPDTSVYDRNRQGVVYRIPLSDGSVNPITLAPVEETGLLDQDDKPTGCFPNQLYATAVNADRLYVTSVCASPKGPLSAFKKPDGTTTPANFKTLMHPVLFAIDIVTNKEMPGERRILTKEIEDLNAASPDAVPRMPLIPTDLVFARTNPDAKREAFVTAMGADAVFRLGDSGEPIGFLDIAPKDGAGGHLPIGTAVLEKAGLALVLNDQSMSVSVVDLKSNSVATVQKSIETNKHALATRDSDANAGHFLFATGTDEWSLNGQAWGSCEGCHPDGLSDGVTWFFSRGPRRTLSTAGTYDPEGKNQRVLLWTGNVDEVHDVEGIVRTVTGGVGAVIWKYPLGTPKSDFRIVYDGTSGVAGKPTSTLRNNLNGSVKALLESTSAPCKLDSTVCDRSPTREWNQIDEFIKTVRAPNRPTSLRTDNGSDTRSVSIGETLFNQGRCAACHGGPNWTISRVFYPPGPEYNGELPFTPPAPNPDGTYPEFKLGRLRTETYTVPPELQPLNPPAASTGVAPFRMWKPPAGMTPFVYLYGTDTTDKYDALKKTHGNDQINCVLRAVGTFPVQPTAPATNTQGIVAPGAPPVLEVRSDMKTLANGSNGFNVPSLVGLATAGSYFHAGNARTLEEAFDATFDAHLRALNPNFLTNPTTRKTDVANLIAYLLSIDDARTVQPVPTGMDLCAQMVVSGSVTAPAPSAQQCAPGETRCANEANLQTCGLNGAWGTATPCADGQACTTCTGTATCSGFVPPKRMDDIHVDGYSDEDIWLSMGETKAYFVSDRPSTAGGPSEWAVWTAERATIKDPFGPATRVPVAHTGIYSISLEGDMNTLYFEGAQVGGIKGLFKALESPGPVGGAFDAGTLLYIDSGGPWISRDTTRLYYDSGGNINVADRVGDSFGGTYRSVMIDGYAPVVSADELTLYFARSSGTVAGSDTWMARRTSIGDPFGNAVQVASVSTVGSDDIPNWISDDGCHYYMHMAQADAPSYVYTSARE